MSTSKISDWLTLGANVGVIVGLIFLGLELKSANDLAEASAYRNRTTEIQASLVTAATSPDLSAILLKADTQGIDALSEIEARRYKYWLWAVSLRMQSQFNDFRYGYLDENSYRQMLSEAARQYPQWQQVGLNLTDPEFRDAIESELARQQEPDDP